MRPGRYRSRFRSRRLFRDESCVAANQPRVSVIYLRLSERAPAGGVCESRIAFKTWPRLSEQWQKCTYKLLFFEMDKEIQTIIQGLTFAATLSQPESAHGRTVIG